MTQHPSRPSPIIISRKVRLWPEIPHDVVEIPPAPSEPSPPGILTIITLLLSVAGIAVSGFIFSKIGGGSSLFFLAFMAMGAFAAIGSLITFFVQLRTSRRQRKYLLAAYKVKLLETEQRLRLLQQKERQARIDLDPPFIPPSIKMACYDQVTVTSLMQHSCNEQDITLWSRRPGDPDFLTVRTGMGSRPASYQISDHHDKNRIALPTSFDQCNQYAYALTEQYQSLVAPITVKVDEYGPLAISSTPRDIFRARNLMRSMVSQLVYHHSPEDVRVIVLTPESQGNEWQWATMLPHMQMYDPNESSMDATTMQGPHAVAVGPEAIAELLPLLSRELSRRELLLGDERHSSVPTMLPHLVIVIDAFDPTRDLDPPPLPVPLMTFAQPNTPMMNRSRLTVSPLKRPEMTLALSRGKQLGVSVLCICAAKTDIPATSNMAIDLEVASYPDMHSTIFLELPDIEQPIRKKRRSSRRDRAAAEPTAILTRPQACVRLLRPDPPALLACDLLDIAPVDALHHFVMSMQLLRPATTKREQLRTQVDIRSLFDPALDLMAYDPLKLWLDPAFHGAPASNGNGRQAGSVPLLRIPIGQKIGDEIQYLDLLRDGPHGLLIGQTGSGKSELLQTIITSLALLYRPTEVTFLLIDYKAGLALEPFRPLPHTIGFLSNVSSPALIQRFITMLRAEAIRRETRLKEGKMTPRLIIVIDEFAEMAKRTETVLDELFTITRVGREIGMHLLLSAQRPEGIIGTKVRDYVQYRFCLRCASDDDSREVLGRTDAAKLPVSIPGRGYLLHGDNQLDLFQAGRATLPVPY